MGDFDDEEYLREISPLFHADQMVKPLIVLQGANDPRVIQVESDEIVEKVRANGVPVEYIVFEDEGHGFLKKENREKGYKAILAFLDTYLRGDS
jgi:dipeptidyl aminopeptidase/acylaminoacyl peptidase